VLYIQNCNLFLISLTTVSISILYKHLTERQEARETGSLEDTFCIKTTISLQKLCIIIHYLCMNLQHHDFLHSWLLKEILGIALTDQNSDSFCPISCFQQYIIPTVWKCIKYIRKLQIIWLHMVFLCWGGWCFVGCGVLFFY